MDPVQIIVSALAAGAAAAVSDTAEQAIKDAYQGIKSYILAHYHAVDFKPLERIPGSERKQESLAEDLELAGADQDTELLEQAKALIDLVDEREPSLAETVGVDVERVRAAYFRAKDVTARGTQSTGVRMRDSEFEGGVEFENIEADSEQNRPKEDQQ